MAQTKPDTLILKYIGTDSWSRPVYQDQFDRLWKDILLGDYDTPALYSAYNNAFDGEPDMPIKREYVIQ